METPFTIGPWNTLILCLAVMVRLFFALKAKSENLKEPFTLKKYFDTRHLIRWGGHLFTALTLGLFVPELFLDYLAPKWLPEVTSWSFAGDFVLGFLGYEVIKLTEKIIRPLVEKITGQKFDKK